MIKLGVCTKYTNIDKAAAAGFDYIEENFTGIARMSDEEFSAMLAAMENAPIGIEACNCMVPGDIKITGPDVNAAQIHDYLNIAFDRAAQLGVKTVVFGSGGARRVPAGFDTAQAWRQINNFLRIAEGHAAKYDITVVIEPLRAGECNIMNYVSEGTLMASLVNMPHIAVLADTYHMAMGHEPFSAIEMAGPLLRHVHVANAIGRVYPKKGDGERYKELFDALKAIGYDLRVSVEAGFSDFEKDLADAYECLNEYR